MSNDTLTNIIILLYIHCYWLLFINDDVTHVSRRFKFRNLNFFLNEDLRNLHYTIFYILLYAYLNNIILSDVRYR